MVSTKCAKPATAETVNGLQVDCLDSSSTRNPKSRHDNGGAKQSWRDALPIDPAAEMFTAPVQTVENLLSHKLAREPWIWRKALLPWPISAGAKVVGLTIADFCIDRDSGVSFWSYLKIGKQCDMTERGVRACVATLTKAAFLTTKKIRFRGSLDIRLSLPPTIRQSVMSVTDSESYPSRPCRSIRHEREAHSVTAVPPILSSYPSNHNPSKRGATYGSEVSRPSLDLFPDGLPHGLVKRCNDRESAKIVIGTTCANLLGYGLHPEDCAARIDGKDADAVILSRLPPVNLFLMVERCIAGELSKQELAVAVAELGIPRSAP